MSLGASRIDGKGSFGALDCLLEAVKLRQCHDQVVVRFRIVRPQSDQLAILLDRVLKAAELGQGSGIVVRPVDVLRLELEDTLIVLERRLVILGQVHRQGEVVTSVDGSWIQPDGAPKRLDREADRSLLSLQRAEQERGIEMVRLPRDNLIVHLRCIGEMAGAMTCERHLQPASQIFCTQTLVPVLSHARGADQCCWRAEISQNTMKFAIRWIRSGSDRRGGWPWSDTSTTSMSCRRSRIAATVAGVRMSELTPWITMMGTLASASNWFHSAGSGRSKSAAASVLARFTS